MDETILEQVDGFVSELTRLLNGSQPKESISCLFDEYRTLATLIAEKSCPHDASCFNENYASYYKAEGHKVTESNSFSVYYYHCPFGTNERETGYYSNHEDVTIVQKHGGSYKLIFKAHASMDKIDEKRTADSGNNRYKNEPPRVWEVDLSITSV